LFVKSNVEKRILPTNFSFAAAGKWTINEDGGFLIVLHESQDTAKKHATKKNLNDPHIIRTILGVNAKSSDISDMVLNPTATHALQGVPLQ
jgi:uncharacterized lipoprotein NlpE involved in copper resistance